MNGSFKLVYGEVDTALRNILVQTSSGMFKNPFSFQGRIRRLEFALSALLVTVLFIPILFLILYVDSTAGILVLPLYWFAYAQGAKRCHDLDTSGWFQLIPFYSLWMLFADGSRDKNRYGYSPKVIVVYSSTTTFSNDPTIQEHDSDDDI